jgi:hypothetical protein
LHFFILKLNLCYLSPVTADICPAHLPAAIFFLNKASASRNKDKTVIRNLSTLVRSALTHHPNAACQLSQVKIHPFRVIAFLWNPQSAKYKETNWRLKFHNLASLDCEVAVAEAEWILRLRRKGWGAFAPNSKTAIARCLCSPVA